MSFVCQVWGGNKRAFLGSVTLVFLGLVILAMSVLTLYEQSGAYGGVVTASPSGGAVTKAVYYLPYPGILPDSPWYKLKAVRDQVSLWLVFNDVKKADRELTYANKRIGAAKFLFEKGSNGLAVSTATKAEKYLEKAFVRVDKLTKDGKDAKSLLLEMKKAVVKHREILEELVAGVEGFDKNGAEETLKMNNLLEQRINQTWLEAK